MKVIVLFCFLFPVLCLAQSNSFDQALKQLEKNPDNIKLQKACIDLLTSDRVSKPTELIANYLQLNKVVEKSTNDTLKIEVLGQLANCYNTTGDYNKALHYGLIAEKSAIKSKPELLSSIYNLIGNTYLGLGKNEQMIEAFTKCYELAQKYDNQKLMAYGAGGLGNYYGSINDFKTANKWNIKAINAFDATDLTFASCIIRTNLAGTYRQMKNMPMAKKYLAEAENLLTKPQIINYCHELVYAEKGQQALVNQNFPLAIESFKLAIHFGEIDNAKHNISEHYKELSKAFELAGQPTQSLSALKQHLLYKDSVFNEESSKQLIEIEERYKSEKKDAEIRLLTKSNELNSSELKRKSILIWSFGFGGLLVIGLVFLLWLSIRRKNRNNHVLAQKNRVIEEKQLEILSSINYAKRIQFTLLASDFLLKSNLQNHFVFFQPKDIVSGDFYWAIKTKTHFFLAVCDCTGHGVPGAFMSLLNINFLKEAITEKHMEKPGEIFDFVRNRLVENLNEEGYNDGMDGVLVAFNLQNSEITYAGANKSPFFITNNQPQELPYDKMPIGKGVKQESFKTHILNYSSGDLLYLYTDGYADQFGGKDEKKFKLKNLKSLLQQSSNMSLDKQKESIEQNFNIWKGSLEQLDDVCVFGVEL